MLFLACEFGGVQVVGDVSAVSLFDGGWQLAKDDRCWHMYSQHKKSGPPESTRTNHAYIWMFPKIGVPQNGWFIMENPIKMDDLGVPLFLETPIYTRVVVFSNSQIVLGNDPI